jgi:hypothetical protein
LATGHMSEPGFRQPREAFEAVGVQSTRLSPVPGFFKKSWSE